MLLVPPLLLETGEPPAPEDACAPLLAPPTDLLPPLLPESALFAEQALRAKSKTAIDGAAFSIKPSEL